MFLTRSIGGLTAACVIATSQGQAAMDFTDVTAAANILHTHSHASLASFGDPQIGYMTGGAVAEDFDGDGWIDLYVLQGGDSPNLLYINQKNGTFSNQAAARGADLTGYHMGACAADFDSDGDIDLFISATRSPHKLLINDGSGHFSLDPQTFNQPTSAATSPSWGDINNDGQLDLTLGAWIGGGGGGDFRVYKNQGAGQFQLFQSLVKNYAYTPRFADLDSDGYQDLVGISDFANSSWYRNDRSGLLLPVASLAVGNGMGGDTADIDNDGDLDAYITQIDFGTPGNGNRLLLNNGTGGFSDITTSAGVLNGGWGWGTKFADFDNDGDLDIMEVNGWPVTEPPALSAFNDNPPKLFENVGGNVFNEIAAASGDVANSRQGRSLVVFDYDNDGDEDMFIANNCVLDKSGATPVRTPGPPVLLRNDTVNSNHWLKVELAGSGAPHHRDGIGSRVYATMGSVTQMHELNASSNYLGHGPERIAHFGMGETTTCDVVRAVWTNGDETELRNVAADQAVLLASPTAVVSHRTVDPGEVVTAHIVSTELPVGAVASWSVNGVTFGNPAHFTLTAPGSYSVRLTLANGPLPAGFIRSETLKITVRAPTATDKSVARLWNMQNLAAIRLDTPRPTVHARNLCHTSMAMWDAWAAYDPIAKGVLFHEKASATNLEAARNEAISYAALRVLKARYAASVNASTTLASLDILMVGLGYDPNNTTQAGNTPAAVGNRAAQAVLAFSANDGANNPAGFLGASYTAVNPPLRVSAPGTVMNDPNLWQPLLFEVATTQNGQTADLTQSYIGPNWGGVRPFALPSLDSGSPLHLDSGPPPQLGGDTDAAYKEGNVQVLALSGQLDPSDGVMVDISPATFGNNPLGTNAGSGHPVNPATGQAYAPNVVKRADFARVLAEYWADGPSSETPPGHWNALANEVTDSPGFLRKIGGVGPELSPLEWDVKLYLALNGALHDAAIAAWGCKRVYQSARPISCIRYMAGRGQSSDPSGPSYDPLGLPLVPGLIEVISAASSAPGERHANLAAYPGEIAIKTWTANILPPGVHWHRAVTWMPYQSATFVTPAFPGLVSGHSTFSRAAAEVMVQMTGNEYFPGGLATFTAERNGFLRTSTGPSADIVLQWATYYDAADQAGLSRIYGGIHVPADDTPGRVIGSQCGIRARNLAAKYFDGSIASEPFSARLTASDAGGLQLNWSATRGASYQIEESATLANDSWNPSGVIWAGETDEKVLLPGPTPETPRNFFRIRRLD